MALLFIDGFDHYATADLGKKWDTVSGATVNATSGRRGTGAMQVQNGSRVLKNIVASSTIITGFAFFPASISGSSATLYSDAIYNVSDAGIDHCCVTVRSDGALVANRMPGGSFVVLGASVGGVVLVNAWNYIEVKMTVHDTAGAVEIRCNGVTVLNLTNVDTRNGGAAQISQVRYGGNIGTNAASNFDDLYICNTVGTTNNDFLGDVRVESLYPSGDGTYSQFVPSTGTVHYTLVDETTPNTTDYVDGTTVGDKDTYAMANLTPIASQTIFGVQVNAALAKDDAGAKSAATMVRSGSTDASGSPVALTITQKYASQIFETNPSGAVPWTETAVNGMEAGVIVTA